MIFSNNVSYFCLEKVVVMKTFSNFLRYRKLLINFNVLNLRQPLVYQLWNGLNRVLESDYLAGFLSIVFVALVNFVVLKFLVFLPRSTGT